MTVRYSKNLKLLARELRNNSTPEEIKLWMRLRRNQLMGYDFHRQKPIGNYIADFYCYQLKLVIEIDGSWHFTDDETMRRDLQKQEYIKSIGFTVMRFTNKEVTDEIENVIQRLAQYILDCEAAKSASESNG